MTEDERGSKWQVAGDFPLATCHLLPSTFFLAVVFSATTTRVSPSGKAVAFQASP